MDSLQAIKAHFMRKGSLDELCEPVLVPTVLPGPLVMDDQRTKHAASVSASFHRTLLAFKNSRVTIKSADGLLELPDLDSAQVAHAVHGSTLLARSTALSAFLTPTGATMALLSVWVSSASASARKSKLSAGKATPAPAAGALVRLTIVMLFTEDCLSLK